MFKTVNFPVQPGINKESYIKGLKLVDWDGLYKLVTTV